MKLPEIILASTPESDGHMYPPLTDSLPYISFKFDVNDNGWKYFTVKNSDGQSKIPRWSRTQMA